MLLLILVKQWGFLCMGVLKIFRRLLSYMESWMVFYALFNLEYLRNGEGVENKVG